MVILASWVDNARTELHGTRLRANEYRKVLSTPVTECVADDGGHNGHLANVALLRASASCRAAVGPLPMDRRCDATLSAGNEKNHDIYENGGIFVVSYL